MRELPIRLNCTDCATFTDFDKVRENVVNCNGCGKNHSTDSLHLVLPDKVYERTADGTLLEGTP